MAAHAAGMAPPLAGAIPCMTSWRPSATGYQSEMYGRWQCIAVGLCRRPADGRSSPAVQFDHIAAGRLCQRGRYGDGVTGAHGSTSASQQPAHRVQQNGIAKELHSPSPRYGACGAAEVGRSSLVEESASRPQAVAADNQLVMQCRHPMLADVDVATRVNVHMPWFVRTGSQPTRCAGRRAHCRAALRKCQPMDHESGRRPQCSHQAHVIQCRDARIRPRHAPESHD